MRVLMVLLALAVTPFVAGVSQSSQGSNCDNGQGDEHRSAQGTANAHRGQCADPPPAPPPASGCAVTPALSLGTATIDGSVYDGSTWAGLANWCVELSGTVSATVATDASGHYIFTGLPGGTYLVCQVVPSGWTQSFPWSGPSCPTGYFGWGFSISDGQGAGWNNFTNMPQ